MKLKNPTKLLPAPLGNGGHLANMTANRSKLHTLKQQRIDLDHQIKSLELRSANRSRVTPKKASAPKNQGAVK